MLTPEFTISQGDTFVFLTIFAPYTKITNVEITIDGNTFLFFAKPYYLKLIFPREVQDEGSSCKYEVDNGAYVVKVKKALPGEKFPDLDLMTTLLCEKKSRFGPSIEVLNVDENELLENEDKPIDWEIEDLEGISHGLDSSYGYGFANKTHNLPVMDVLQEVLHIHDLDTTSLSDRRDLRKAAEDDKFDDDHYLADLYETEDIDDVLSYVQWWIGDAPSLSSDDKLLLQNFPNREYLLTNLERRVVFLGLVDILVGYAYNARVVQGELNVGSSWTIRTISSTLSWCDVHLDLRDLLIANYRRMLCYPQHRNWKLAEKVVEDVTTILKLGTRCALRCLLATYVTFRDADESPCYLLNQLYIQDYCVWIQKQRGCDQTMTSLASAILNCKISKSDVGFELDLLEEAALLAIEDQTTSAESQDDTEGDIDDDVIQSLNTLTIVE